MLSIFKLYETIDESSDINLLNINLLQKISLDLQIKCMEFAIDSLIKDS